jgi:hypothetical protein
MQFAIGVTVLEYSFVKHSRGPLGVKMSDLLWMSNMTTLFVMPPKLELCKHR